MMTKTRRRAATVLLLVLTATPIMVGTGAGTAWAQDTTTTIEPTTTTTLAPPTTTSSTTTTTAPPTTTSTTHAATTTTHESTTTTHPTTTTTRATSSSSTTPWGWIILALVLVLAAILVAVLIGRSKRQGREADWQRSVRPALTAAELARDLVLSQSENDDAQRRASVGVQVDDAVEGLERAAENAPDDLSRNMCTRSAESLRGLAFAVEADHLMRSGGEHPTGEQLAAADAARRNRTAELQANLLELKAAVTPPPPNGH
jgi:uncharacterized protein HemX